MKKKRSTKRRKKTMQIKMLAWSHDPIGCNKLIRISLSLVQKKMPYELRQSPSWESAVAQAIAIEGHDQEIVDCLMEWLWDKLPGYKPPSDLSALWEEVLEQRTMKAIKKMAAQAWLEACRLETKIMTTRLLNNRAEVIPLLTSLSECSKAVDVANPLLWAVMHSNQSQRREDVVSSVVEILSVVATDPIFLRNTIIAELMPIEEAKRQYPIGGKEVDREQRAADDLWTNSWYEYDPPRLLERIVERVNDPAYGYSTVP